MDGCDLDTDEGDQLTDYAYSGADINERLRQRVIELCDALGLDGCWQDRKRKNYWIKDVRGSGNYTSVSVRVDDGYWHDFHYGKGDKRGGGDLIHLIAVFKFDGDDKAAIKWAVNDFLRLDTKKRDPEAEERVRKRKAEQAERQREAEERNRKIARAIWLDAQPLTGHDPASLYLLNRGIDVLKLAGGVPGALRFDPKCLALPEDAYLPAMLACVSATGRGMISCHRTYLEFAGGVWRKAWKGVMRDKRPVAAKRSLGSFAGGSIRLTRGASGKELKLAPKGEWVGISEGIENALTIAQAVPELRTMAAVSMSNVGNVELPEQIGGVYIIADNDIKQAAIEGLEAALDRLEERGLTPKIIRAEGKYKDLNDLQTGVERDDRTDR